MPAEIADRERVVVLGAEGSGIIERAVADDGHHRNAQGRGHRQRFHGVHPTHTAAAHKNAGTASGGVFDDFELRVLAVGGDEFAIHLAVGDELRHKLHYGVVGTNRESSHHIDIGQLAGDCHRLRPCD